ncbi:MAG: hypothetical protein ACI3XQ_07040 [Eubacteriales bacterium]
MDLIYSNKSKEEIGVLQNYELDLAFGADENNFECKVSSNNHCLDAGYYLHIDGTDFGGIVDSIESDTEKQEVIYRGRTWQGIMASRIILPRQSNDSGSSLVSININYAVGSYLELSGEVNDVISHIIARSNLQPYFVASMEDTGVIVTHKFDRYTDVYSGLCKMLDSVGMKMKMEYIDRRVTVSAIPLIDYSFENEIDSDSVQMTVKRNYNAVNHLICLGSGELENRMVLHLYADENGNISTTQTQFYDKEYAEIYDYPSVESEEELKAGGTERLKELWEHDQMTISIDESENIYDIGDIVGAYDDITKISATAKITKKFVTVKDGNTTISYEVGD